jgi:hypothetical protein
MRAYRQPISKEVPLNINGSNTFGRYPKISVEQTYNMFLSDGWLVTYAGYKAIHNFNSSGKGRGIFNSTRFNHLVFVIDNEVFIYDTFGNYNKIAELESYAGDVFISENNARQIGICDKKDIYIFDYSTTIFTKSSLGFNAAYLEFQDGFFIAPDRDNPAWRLSAPNNGLSWPLGANNEGTFQTKPDNVQACIKFPGRGNQLFVMGSTVTEPWTNVGYQLFPYQRSAAYNIDYGCANPATIASGDTFVIWLGINEKAGLAIMYSSGGDVIQISNDGINYKLASVKNIENAFGFLYKQDGVLFYQLTFPDIRDNFSLAYNFNDKTFISVTDHNNNCHIAKNVAYFDGKYFFVSHNDGTLYEMSSNYTTYNGLEIPRSRVCKSLRTKTQGNFIAKSAGFTIEQGMPTEKSYTEPKLDKGTINSAADFPELTGTNPVQSGWMYTIGGTTGTTVTDNDPTKTNTGLNFVAGTRIVWGNYLNQATYSWERIEDVNPCVDMLKSTDGGMSFSSSERLYLNDVGNARNKLLWRNLGGCNDLTLQFRFWGLNRFVATEGIVETSE